MSWCKIASHNGDVIHTKVPEDLSKQNKREREREREAGIADPIQDPI